MYTVFAGEDQHDFDHRYEAIEKAKELSQEERGQVEIEDLLGRESFVYRGGSLQSYVYEMRHRRTPAPRSEIAPEIMPETALSTIPAPTAEA